MEPVHRDLLQLATLASKQVRLHALVRSNADQDPGLRTYTHALSPHYVKQSPRVNVPTVGLVKAILEPCSELLWEAQPRGPGLLVYNAYTEEYFRLWVVIIRLIEDSVGLAKPLCSHKQPAYIGARTHAIYVAVAAKPVQSQQYTSSILCHYSISVLAYINHS